MFKEFKDKEVKPDSPDTGLGWATKLNNLKDWWPEERRKRMKI